MGNDNEAGRVERVVDGTRDWVERTGGDVVHRLGHAWKSVRDHQTSTSDEKNGQQPKPVDDETLFSRDRQVEVARWSGSCGGR